ncbi:MAG: peptidyl-prolyl cis-trans isomerase [Kiritimatiellia bacterium]|nr:peptidyl-prolyl cis-trans isomerase [Lentisphaerota bacterium]
MKISKLHVLVLLGSIVFAARGERIPMDGYAAMVNDRVITVSDVISAMQPVEQQLRQSLDGAELTMKLEEAYTNALESLIERELIMDEFQRLQGALPEAVVNNRMQEIERMRFNNNRAELLKALDAEGLTMSEWRESLRNSMIVSYMREREVDGRIMVTPGDVREAYNARSAEFQVPAKVELRMIVINRGRTEEENDLKLQQAQDLVRRLREGQEFDELARRFSEGIKAGEGGYWGWIDPSTRRAELAQAIASLDVGTVSDVLEVEDVLYILKIEGRRNASKVSFDEVQNSLRDELRREQARDLHRDWIKRLKRDAYIQRF